MTTATADGNDDIVLAGEYVLGLLAAVEARAFETRVGAEPRLRQVVAEWTEGLVTLTDNVAAVAPPAALKAAIDRRLFPAPVRRLSLGSLLLGALSGAVAVLALVLVLPFLGPQSAVPEFQARIATTDASLVVLASLDADTGVLVVQRTAGAPADGRSLELWLIPEGATVPISLGVVDLAEAALTLTPELVAQFRGGTVAISDEPLGGSPTGAPTNVLGAGPVTLV
jgi:anti-sigma-K factor RskA